MRLIYVGWTGLLIGGLLYKIGGMSSLNISYAGIDKYANLRAFVNNRL